MNLFYVYRIQVRLIKLALISIFLGKWNHFQFISKLISYIYDQFIFSNITFQYSIKTNLQIPNDIEKQNFQNESIINGMLFDKNNNVFSVIMIHKFTPVKWKRILNYFPFIEKEIQKFIPIPNEKYNGNNKINLFGNASFKTKQYFDPNQSHLEIHIPKKSNLCFSTQKECIYNIYGTFVLISKEKISFDTHLDGIQQYSSNIDHASNETNHIELLQSNSNISNSTMSCYSLIATNYMIPVPAMDFVYANNLEHRLVIMYNTFINERLNDVQRDQHLIFAQEIGLEITENKLSGQLEKEILNWIPFDKDTSLRNIFFPHIHEEFSIQITIEQANRFPELELLLRKLLYKQEMFHFIPQLTWMLCIMDEEMHYFLRSLDSQSYKSLETQALSFIGFNFLDFLHNQNLHAPRAMLFKSFTKYYSFSKIETTHNRFKQNYFSPVISFLGITIIKWHMMQHVWKFKTMWSIEDNSIQWNISDRNVENTLFFQSNDKNNKINTNLILSQNIQEPNKNNLHKDWLYSSFSTIYNITYIFLRAIGRDVSTPKSVMPYFLFMLNELNFHNIDKIREELDIILKAYDILKEYDNPIMMPQLIEFLLNVLTKFIITCENNIFNDKSNDTNQLSRKRLSPFLKASSKYIREEVLLISKLSSK